MDEVRELDLNALEEVTGGVQKTVYTGTPEKAAIRNAPGDGKVIAALPNGTVVDTLGAPVYDRATGRNWVEVRFTNSHGKSKKGWIAASIVGMKR